jgi:hypothetical protein
MHESDPLDNNGMYVSKTRAPIADNSRTVLVDS